MRQGIVLTGLGVAVWAVSTLFFLLFGDFVLLEVGDSYFGSSLFLLETLTLLLLIGLSLVVRLRLFRERGSATRFGFTATMIGLALNSFTLLQRDSVFTAFNEGQHQAYTIWMTIAYALTLAVPAIVDRIIREPEKEEVRATSVVAGFGHPEGDAASDNEQARDVDAPSVAKE